MREEVKGMRVHTTSKHNALFTAQWLSTRFKVGFDLAVSSRNIIMLDYDIKKPIEEVKKDCAVIQKLIFERLPSHKATEIKSFENIPYAIFETQHGYHVIFGVRLTYTEWQIIYRQIYLGCLNKMFEGLDCVHIKASLDRDYATLRLSPTTKLVYLHNTSVEKIIEKAKRHMLEKYSVEEVERMLSEYERRQQG